MYQLSFSDFHSEFSNGFFLFVNVSLVFQTTLEQEINNNPEHEPKDMLLTLYRAVRPEDNEISNTAVYRDARKLYESGAQWRSKDSPFLRLLCSRRFVQFLRKLIKKTVVQLFSSIHLAMDN